MYQDVLLFLPATQFSSERMGVDFDLPNSQVFLLFFHLHCGFLLFAMGCDLIWTADADVSLTHLRIFHLRLFYFNGDLTYYSSLSSRWRRFGKKYKHFLWCGRCTANCRLSTAPLCPVRRPKPLVCVPICVCAYSRVFCVVCASAYIRRPILSCMQLVDVMISCLIWFSFFCFWFSCTDNLYASITDKGFLCLEEKNLLPANSSVGKYFMVILLIFVVFLLHWRVPILAHNPLSTF